MSKEKAVVTKTQMGEEHRHPAFGVVTIADTSARGMALFGTNIEHSDFITVRVSDALRFRSNNHDKVHEEKQIVEFMMSRQQFASLASGRSKANGVPCTLRWVRHEGRKPMIDPETEVERFSKDAQEEFKKLAQQIESLVDETRAELTAAKVSKVRQEAILAPLVLISRKLGGTLPYLQSVFYETVEDIVHEAKSVIESYADSQGIEETQKPRMLKPSEEN
ncbi:hypothetical protein [Sulfitobacter sp. R18_1]|uniref:hypothetical protein n=1 Tax=Sulfitobacter sp. R18_1 TaxID=2821104 RepID=UPI001AD9D5CE|nr:hypothetical protein [Sulfitobacter sp. R18_1]MBO9428349.1 hypothetical protein [Sulfitobacter sp. R18_1]